MGRVRLQELASNADIVCIYLQHILSSSFAACCGKFCVLLWNDSVQHVSSVRNNTRGHKVGKATERRWFLILKYVTHPVFFKGHVFWSSIRGRRAAASMCLSRFADNPDFGDCINSEWKCCCMHDSQGDDPMVMTANIVSEAPQEISALPWFVIRCLKHVLWSGRNRIRWGTAYRFGWQGITSKTQMNSHIFIWESLV